MGKRAFLLFFFLFGCGTTAAPELPQADNTILIDLTGDFMDTELTVLPGDNIVIQNRDGSPHTVTSQSSPGAFDNTGDFDVVIPARSGNILTVPETSLPGDVFYYYCRFHQDAYPNANGTLTIE